MSNIATKLTYLNETKSKIKNSINLTGVNITNEDTFRSYSDKLKQGLLDVLNNGNDYLYNNFPQTTGTGKNITLNNTLEAPIKSELLGNTSQNGTPTPDAPVKVINATGGQVVKVSNGSQEQTYEINLGKNLINLADGTYDNEIVATTQNGIITLNGTTTATRFIFIPLNTKLSLINEEKYTISTNNEIANGNVRFRIDDNGSYDTILNKVNSTKTITYSSDNTLYDKRIVIRIASGTTLDNFVIKPMIEQGSQATSYAPYFTPIELCKIGDYQDRIYYNNGKWYLENKHNKIDSYNGETITTDYISTTGGLDTGATIYYGVETTTTEITEQNYPTLYSELNSLLSAKSYDGTTNITITAETPADIKITALKNE